MMKWWNDGNAETCETDEKDANEEQDYDEHLKLMDIKIIMKNDNKYETDEH